ncbi:MAG: YlxR family protein [Chloroflexi bacterium]|nr:YlxR family protein [Chloroflexota bacterium]
MAKHIPQRTCIGCRAVQGKRQLVRVVRQADGHVRLDATGKAPGRGAYIHATGSCWQRALSAGRLAHALKIDRIEDADRAELQVYAATLPKEDETAQ